ncbi:MAG TPA: hypothetical protein VGE39_01485 [Prosthecobacter sp.]
MQLTIEGDDEHRKGIEAAAEDEREGNVYKAEEENDMRGLETLCSSR